MDPVELLRSAFGFDEFRPAQRQVIDLVLEGQNVLGVMPTGSGKSLCFQLPALAQPGVTLVVSPLIALMKDQVDHLEQLRLPASVVNSTVPREVQQARLERAIRGELKLLYVSPERFQNDAFRAALKRMKVSIFAVDEAHCVSLWGHDFRPDYLRLRSVIEELGNPRVIALTATATPAVREDIVKQLGIQDARQVVSGFDRPNLRLEVRETATAGDKIRAIVDLCKHMPTGIIYAGTRRNVEEIYRALQRKDIDVVAYHAGLSLQQRKLVQDRFMSKAAGFIVATNAFGMGIDRSDVRFVVHSDIPVSLEAYYQEIGRAGRDGAPARCLLLFNYADKWIPELFIDASHPKPEYLKEVFGVLVEFGKPVVSGDDWKRATAHTDQRFHSAVSLLQRSGYLERTRSDGTPGVRILRPADRQLHGFNFAELERRREFEHRKLGIMLQYASRFRNHCFRSFLLRYFGEWSKVRDCGNCSRCAPNAKWVAAEVSSAAKVKPEAAATSRSLAPAAASDKTTVVGLKILSCILRAQEQLGREKIAKILAGSNESAIHGFRSLTTYGILSEYSIAAIVSMIDHMILEGYIEGGEGYRPVISVSSKGRDFLKTRPTISMPGV